MPDKRLFIGNLPENTSEKDLSSEFASYGAVKSVELKSKTNAFDEENRFAFLTIDINDRMVSQCIQEFKDQKYRGNYLSVSLAKESFLDRLKREREESAGNKIYSAPKTEAPFIRPPPERVLQKIPSFTKPKVQESDDSSESSEDESDLPPVKDQDPLKNKKIMESDQKRAESLRKMADEYKMKKLAIKSALANIDGSKNKIRFDDYEPADEPHSKKQKVQPNLFENDEDDEGGFENDFQVKQQFQGAKGQKLLELQTRFKQDKRFQMDQKFIDDDQRVDEEYEEEGQGDDAGEEDEKNWQLGILENVVGKKFNRDPQPSKNVKKVTMTRFDPTREDHYTVKSGEDLAREKKKNKKLREPQPDINEIEVSKETFYKIGDNFTTAFKSSTTENKGGGFSLLSMFGATDEKSAISAYSEIKIVDGKKSKKHKEQNPFKYDSSDSEDDEMPALKATKEEGQVAAGKKKELRRETFFFAQNDQRFVDGANFFRFVEVTDDKEDFDVNRGELKKIVKNKVKKTQKKFGNIFRMKKKQKK